MTITQSKLKSGTLTLGETSFACQATNVQIVPDYDETGDTTETLCGDSLTPDSVRTNTLKITAIQDFSKAAGFIAYTWAHELELVEFSWAPNLDALGVTYTGTVQIKAAAVGGDVNTRLTSDVEWTIVGDVTPTYAT